MHRGYTKRWRKRWDKGYHKDLLLWVMMDWFIDHANFKENEFPFIWKGAVVEMVKVERGQCFFTFEGLANRFSGPKNAVSRKMVRSRVQLLEKIGFLGHKSGRKYQIVTICNYDKYNSLAEVEGRKPGHKGDIKGTLKGHKGDIPNKDKNVKNVKNDKNKENGTRSWPSDFCMDDKLKKYAIGGGIDPEKLAPFFEDFRDWAKSKGAKYKDWRAAFRTRVNKAPEYGKQFLKPGTMSNKKISKQEQIQINNAISSQEWMDEKL